MLSDVEDVCVCLCEMQIKHHIEQPRPAWTAGGAVSSASLCLAPFISCHPLSVSMHHTLSLFLLFLTCICSLYLSAHALSLSPSLPAVVCGDRGSLCQVISLLSHDSVIETVWVTATDTHIHTQKEERQKKAERSAKLHPKRCDFCFFSVVSLLFQQGRHTSD